MAISILALSCSTKNDPEQKHEVTFKLSQLTVETQPMNSPRRAPQATILDDEGGSPLTDLYIFEGSTQLIHQTNDDQNFGTVTLELSYGQHNLSFLCTRSTGITVENGEISMSSIRSTFGKLLQLNVNGASTQEVILDRINSFLFLTINDAFPAGSNQILITIDPKYSALSTSTLLGINGEAATVTTGCSGNVGQSGANYKINLLCPVLDEEFTSDVTISVKNAQGAVTHSVVVEDVRFAANTKTLLSGNLFQSPGATVTVNTTWNQDIVGNF